MFEVQVLSAVQNLSAALDTVPGQFGLRQWNNGEYKIRIGVLSANDSEGKSLPTFENIDLRIDNQGNWMLPIIEGTRITGFVAATLDEVVNFAKPYRAEAVKQQSAAYFINIHT